MTKTSYVRKYISTLIYALVAGIAGFCLMLSLTGCATGNPVEIFGGFTIGDSQHTQQVDKENFTTVIDDSTGTEYVTVLRIEPTQTNQLDIDALKTAINNAQVNWYQLIDSNTMGTGEKEFDYLYLPIDSTYMNLVTVQSYLNNMGDYIVSLLTPAQYQEYLANTSSVDFYNNETTYYGPAAMNKSQ